MSQMQTVVTDKWILCPVCAGFAFLLRKSLYLSVIPSALFVESGIISGNIMLVIVAIIFAPCHIRISYMNAVYKGDN